MDTRPTNVTHRHQDRQWDIRINLQTDEYLTTVLDKIKQYYGTGKMRYILVGGLEIGTRPAQDDYQVRHSHIAAIFHDPISKGAIIKNWGIVEGNGYYMVREFEVCISKNCRLPTFLQHFLGSKEQRSTI